MSPCSNFRIFDGEDDLGIVRNDSHMIFEWLGGKVLFSATRLGGSMSCHFATGKRELRKVKHAMSEFIQFIFYAFEWCTMVITMLPDGNDSIARVIKKVGFTKFCEYEKGSGYMRCRNG